MILVDPEEFLVTQSLIFKCEQKTSWTTGLKLVKISKSVNFYFAVMCRCEDAAK